MLAPAAPPTDVRRQCRVGYRRGMSDVTIDLAPSESPRSAAERAAADAGPGLRPGLHRPHGHGALLAGAGLARRPPRRRTRRSTLDPATSALHYGQAIFEGLKAYHQRDGSVALFRPEQNARRFQRSARRLAMAEVPEQLFLDAVRALVDGRPRLGADRRRAGAVPAAAGVRPRPVPRGASVARLPVPAVRLAGRRVLPRWGAAGVGVALDRVRARGARAAPARPSAPATTPPPWSPRPRPPSRAATRWSGSTRSSTGTSRRWAA